jgi:hypothetical protein
MVDVPEGFEIERKREGISIPEGFELEAKSPPSLKQNVIYGAQGALSGLSGVLGAPVDIVNLAVGAEKPFLGSQSIRSGLQTVMERAGALTGRSVPGTRYTYDNIQEVPADYRPSARAGEASGATLPFVGALGLAARGAPIAQTVAAAAAPPAAPGVLPAAQQAVRGMVADAASNPYFALSQLPSTIGAAAGAFGAEAVFPGSEGAQALGQLGGGLAGALGAAAAQSGAQSLARARQVAMPTSDDATKQAIAATLAPKLAAAGERPGNIISALEEPAVVSGMLPAERAQSRALTGVQSFLSKSDEELANAVKRSQEAVDRNLRGGVTTAFQPGSQKALIATAQQRQAAFAKNVDDLVSSADERLQAYVQGTAARGERAVSIAEQQARRAAGLAAERISPVAPLGAAERLQTNVAVKNLAEDALSAGRKIEKSLWSKVPVSEQQPINTVNAYRTIRAEMQPEDALPGVTDKILRRYERSIAPPPGEGLEAEAQAFMAARAGGEAPKPITTKDLLNLRSDLLADVRSLRSGQTPDFKNARRIQIIADALLDDVAAAGGREVDIARDYSRALNDRFSRSFAGDILGFKGTGAERVRPELTMEAATAGAPEKVRQQLLDLQRAVEGNPEMAALQERFLRSMSEKLIDPTTNQINPNRVDAFIRDNKAILDVFPQYQTALEQARDAQRAAVGAAEGVTTAQKAADTAIKEASREAEKAKKAVLQKTNDAKREVEKVAAFSRILQAGEKPADAIAKAVEGANPVRDINRLSVLALRGGDDAVGGLRASILDYAMSQRVGNKFTYGAVKDVLNTPLSAEGPTLIQTLVKNKIMTADQALSVDALVNRGIASEISRATGIEVKSFGQQADMAGRYIPRIIGAKLSAMLPAGNMGAGLQMANLAANAAERMASSLPADKVNAMMAKALASEDPKLLIDILERTALIGGGAARGINAQTREILSVLRAMVDRSSYEAERPAGAAFRPEELGRR